MDQIGKFQVSDFDGFVDGVKGTIEWNYGDYLCFFLIFVVNLRLLTNINRKYNNKSHHHTLPAHLHILFFILLISDPNPNPFTFFSITLNFLFTWSLLFPSILPIITKSVPYSSTNSYNLCISFLGQDAMWYFLCFFHPYVCCSAC